MSDAIQADIAAANREKLAELLTDVFLLEPGEFRFDLVRSEIETWDSLGVVAMAVGVEEIFGYHCSPEEATGIVGVKDIVDLLSRQGIAF
jgi:acyl carrier protein